MRRQRFSGQDGKSDLDLIEPGNMHRGEVEVDVPVALEPVLRLRRTRQALKPRTLICRRVVGVASGMLLAIHP